MARSNSLLLRSFALVLIAGLTPAMFGETESPADVAIPPQVIASFQKAPVYPPAAKEARMTGTVVIQTDIDAAGKVRKARVVECSHKNLGFEEAAIAAVQQWRFKPAMFENKAVPYSTKFRLSFGENEVGPGVKATPLSGGAPIKDRLQKRSDRQFASSRNNAPAKRN